MAADIAERAEALLLRHVDPLRRSAAIAVPLKIGTGDGATRLLAFIPNEARLALSTAPKSLVHYDAEIYYNSG